MSLPRFSLPLHILAVLILMLAPGRPLRAETVSAGAPDSAAAPGPVSAALGLGMENVSSDSIGTRASIAYENRRFRHSVDAFGAIERTGGPFLGFERRLGLDVAQITNAGSDSEPRFHVRYPSDREPPVAPRGRRLHPTSHTLDLLVGPLIAYEVGQVTNPVQFLFQIESGLTYNPWPGAKAVATVVFPVYDSFDENPLHPDIDRIRPGLATFEQYAWIPRAGLFSAGAGLFADNRYGLSLGAARPLGEGAFLIDGQADVTGFVAFNETGVEYSNPTVWSAFGGVTWRPPVLDLSLRARYGQFLYGDHSAELELKRSFGDFDLAFSFMRSKDLSVEGVRATFPIPPMERPTRHVLRVLPVERFPISFRTDATPIANYLVGCPSREEFLRQLNTPAMNSNAYRLERPAPAETAKPPVEPLQWANESGVTGFIITPWAGVIRDRSVEVGYAYIPKKWAYNPEGIPRGVYHNEIYYAALGLVPRVEVDLRITRTPGFNPFAGIDPESQLSTDTDHMASFRVALLEPRDRRPGLALGMEDIQGTRRYHSEYLVSGVPFSIFSVQSRFSLGYAFRVFTASRYVLDGSFGAVEVSPWRAVAARFEYDTEKFNVGLGVDLGFGLRVRASALNMESLSYGLGWYHKL